MEDDEDFLRRYRYTVDLVQKWVREANELGIPEGEEDLLNDKLQTALKLDTMVCLFFIVTREDV